MNVKIQAVNVKKAFPVQNEYGKKDQITVLDNFQIQVQEGEFLSILGPSGCGKSTFLSILAGLTSKTSGELIVDGQPVNGVNKKHSVVFQGYALFPWLTVVENVETGLEIRGVPKKERREIALEYINLVGLYTFANRYPHELSGGMKQRVAIARSLAYDPDVLLMDEPFGALDAQTREILQTELLRIWEASKKTIIFITHSLDEAIYLSDRVAIMTARPGRVKKIIDIPLERPRQFEIRNSEEFVQLRQEAWEVLKDEVLQAQGVNPPQEGVPAKKVEQKGKIVNEKVV
ncbi:ABC transporter ATP-binding protein [Peribacillus asahii]|uniref:ABC transporter ATP-binding protein n=1 Tax=Peribacillus asahii TaxID=228899 RepID=UPI00207AE966|nr:ABC transporter ATP-binding protein [Peribacillus asahii]USK58422.1 ABC transporter ATP-binding protein [Peribacillus asahii]